MATEYHKLTKTDLDNVQSSDTDLESNKRNQEAQAYRRELEAMTLAVKEDVSKQLAERQDNTTSWMPGHLNSWREHFEIPSNQTIPLSERNKNNICLKLNPSTPTRTEQWRTPTQLYHHSAGKEGIIIAREAYKQISPFQINDCPYSFLKRILHLVPQLYATQPENAVVFNMIYNKCSEEIQNMIINSEIFLTGNPQALQNFLIKKVGKYPLPELFQLQALMHSKKEMTWREIILRVEHIINFQLNLANDNLSIGARQREYRSKIIMFCDDELMEKLCLKGLLRPMNSETYDEFCNFLYDQDNLPPRNYDFHHNLVTTATNDSAGNLSYLTKSPSITQYQQLDTINPTQPKDLAIASTVKQAHGTMHNKANPKSPRCRACKGPHWVVHCSLVTFEVRRNPVRKCADLNAASQKCYIPACLGTGHTSKCCPYFVWVVRKAICTQ